MTGRRHGFAMNRRWIVVTLLVASCYPVCGRNEDNRIDRWLTCDECIDGERAAVLAMGDAAIPALKAALVGPSARRSELMKAKFGDAYKGSIPGLTRQAYVDSLHANYVATYQKRAATALGDIGGGEAIAALQQAVQDTAARNYRSDVIRVVTFVNTLLNAQHFGGTIRPGRVSFGEPVRVIAGPGGSFAGNASASILDAPFLPTEIPLTRSADSLSFPALGDIGPHAVVISHGAGLRAEVGSVTISSLLDPNDRAMIECTDADSACAVARAPFAGPVFPFTTFLALWNTAPRADNVDYVRFQAGGVNLPVTARLDWKGKANLDLFWKRCAPFTPVPIVGGATDNAFEQTSATIPAGQCWVLLVVMRPDSTARGPAFARLGVTSP